MSNVDNEKGFFRSLVGDLKDYIELKLEILKLDFQEKSAKAISKLVSVLILMLLVFFALFFLLMGLGFYFSQLLGSYAKGFALVGLIYFFLTVLFIILKKSWIEPSIENKIIAQFNSANDENEN